MNAKAFRWFHALLLIAVALQAQGPRRRAVAPQPQASVNTKGFVLALPASATHVVSTVPCTLVDTRNAPGPFGGPRMSPGVTRSFVVPNGPCSGIPVALGYALTFTGITPDAATVHLKAWATGTPIPGTPTLTLSRGTGANPNDTVPGGGAIEASGSGSVDVQSDVGTDLLIELTAYYTPGLVLNINPGPGLFGGGIGNVMLGIAPGGVGTPELAPNAVTPLNISAAGSGPNQVLMSDGGSVTWRLPPQGTITAVNAGPGLSGGGATGTVSLNVNFAGTGSLDTVARSDHKHYVQTVIVNPAASASASGTNLLNAMAGIIDASATKPYLLKVEPGIYDLGTSTLFLKPYIDIEGSGELVTRITHSMGGAATNGTINGTGVDVELRDVTVVSTGGANRSVAIYLSNGSSVLTHVTAIASNGIIDNRGIEVNGTQGLSSPIFRDITVNTTGAEGQLGVAIFNSVNLIIRNATVTVNTTNTGSATGLLNQGGTLSGSQIDVTASAASGEALGFTTFSGATSVLRGASFRVSGNFCVGVTDDSSTISLEDVSINSTGVAAANGVGVYGQTPSTPGSYVVEIDHSRIVTSGVTVTGTPSYTFRIGATKLDGDPVSATAVCAGVYDKNYVFHPSTCP